MLHYKKYGLTETNCSVPMPISDDRKEAIKQLRMIADDIEKGYGGFNFLVGYDFINFPFDIIEGERKRGGEA